MFHVCTGFSQKLTQKRSLPVTTKGSNAKPLRLEELLSQRGLHVITNRRLKDPGAWGRMGVREATYDDLATPKLNGACPVILTWT